MINVKKLIWDTWNVSHIARHNITPDEVEAVCHGSPLVLRGQQKNRLVVIGQTEESLVMTVILQSKGKDKYYPITAYPSDKHDVILYKRLKGGENENENKKNKK